MPEKDKKKATKKKLSLKELDSMLARKEKGKSQANIGDVRQQRKILFELARSNKRVMKLILSELSK